MKKCPYCGFNNPDSSTVCINCGRSLIGVRDDDFIISPDKETSYILEKRENFYRKHITSLLPFYVDLLLVVVVWGLATLFSLLFQGEILLKIFFAGSFAFIFTFFIEATLILTVENSFGEIVTELRTGWIRKYKILIYLSIDMIPVVFPFLLLLVAS